MGWGNLRHTGWGLGGERQGDNSQYSARGLTGYIPAYSKQHCSDFHSLIWSAGLFLKRRELNVNSPG